MPTDDSTMNPPADAESAPTDNGSEEPQQTPRYANIPVTYEAIVELATTRDKLRAKNRELRKQLGDLSSKLESMKDHESTIEKLTQELDEARSQLSAIKEKEFLSSVRSQVKSHLTEGLDDFVVDAIISHVRNKVDAKDDPNEAAKAYLAAIAEHSPNLLAKKQEKQDGTPSEKRDPARPSFVPSGNVKHDVQRFAAGSRVGRIFGSS